jgi:hypothetical protein
MLFLYLSLSHFLIFSLSLLFFSLLDFLSNILEKNFHVNIVSRERFQQLFSHILDLIVDYIHLVREHLI